MKLTRILFCAALPFLAGGAVCNAQEQEKPTVYMVANAHFDTQWRWTAQASINEYVHNTLVQNFALLEKYPDYIFNFEGAIKYQWAKEYYPDLYEKLKEYVKQGRWHISGASWDANDPNIPSIESNIRNIMLGQEFYRKEFGILSTDIMLPDCFGFGWQLPSVAAHCGLTGFGTQKLQWRTHPFYADGSKVPFHFGTWKGLDGERVMAAMDGGEYSWSPRGPITDLADFKRLVEKCPVHAAFRYFGTGDRGGSATPTGAWFVNEAVHNPGEAYNVKFATSDEMFQKYLWDERLPEYDGELLMDVHATGCYTSKVEMKMVNRRNERMLGAAEGISSIVDWMGGTSYPAYTIDEGWKRVLWHQFHDDLTGTSIPEAYLFSYNDEYITLNQSANIIKAGMESVASVMNTAVKGTPVLVFNHVTAANNGIASIEAELPEGCRSFEVFGPDGRKIKSQIIAREGSKATVLFAGNDPSMGISVYELRPSRKAEVLNPALKAGGNSIENRIYKLTVNADGDICSIIDKRYGKELVRQGEAFGYVFFPNNVSVAWPAWEILKNVIDSEPEKVSNEVRVSVEECGSLRAVLKVEKKHAGSTFVQRIILTDGACDERIDIVNDVDWNSRKALLKASFPVAFDAPEATYDLGMGHISRGVNTKTAYEVYAQQWADMTATDDSYGVTIMNDGRYGWDKPDGHTLRLTLLHTPSTGIEWTEQQTQDFGRHTFTYSIVGHKGALDPAAADIIADGLNQPKIVYAEEKHPGKLGRQFSMLSSTSRNLRVKAFKKAQDGDGYIVRVYELSGKGAEGSINFAAGIASAEELNGIEDYKCSASASGKSLPVKSGRFALRTFRVRFADAPVSIARPEFEKVELPFNMVAITTDNFTSQGRLSVLEESFAAEIMPEVVEFQGIPFSFGEPDFDNALKCKSQKLALPEGTRTLHLLVASTWKKGATASFKVGEKSYERTAGYYTGIFGCYGWPGYYESVMRTGDIAYVGTHTHNPSERNKACICSYLYHISIPVDGATEIELPADRRFKIFAATAEK